MNRILIGCLVLFSLVAAISAQAGSSSSSAGSSGGNANYLARLMATSGGGRGRGMMSSGMFPLLALSGGGNDAILPLMMCQNNMNLMCLLALSQGGVI